MNERIKALLIQAQDLARSEVENNPNIKPPYHIPATQVHVGLGLSYEKFAELIVRECLSIVEPTEDSGDEWCVTLKGTAEEIKEHFGVEE
jgi:hypothetical protein